MNKILTVLIGAGGLALAGCNVEQTEEAELPEIDVNATGGQMPEYDVEGPDVDVGTTNETVQVPELDVEMQNETVETPTIDVDTPE